MMEPDEPQELLTSAPDELSGDESECGACTEVLVDSIDGSCRIIDLDSAFFGTVILVDYAEYMRLSGRIWIRYNGQRKTPEDLATQIREAQDDDLPVTLIHMG